VSKHWIELNDTRVNAAAQTDGDLWMVVHALSRLYRPPVHQGIYCPFCEEAGASCEDHIDDNE